MAYTPVTFADGVTPLNAAKMNQLEDGVESAHVIADAAIPKALVDAKGDIVVATGSDAPARLPVGANTQALLADSSQPTGLKWGVAGAALTYEGDHVGATSYDDGDIVVKDGIAYLCVGGPTTQAPNPVPWGPAGMMSGYIKTTDRGVANGVAPLDANSKVPVANAPPYVWTQYAPTFSGGTLGNSSLVGYYLQVGKLVFAKIILTAGTTFAPTGGAQWYLGLPTNRAGTGAHVESGVGWAVKQGIGYYEVMGVAMGTASMQLHIPNAGSPMGGWTGTNPFTWASGDTMHIQLFYEAA